MRNVHTYRICALVSIACVPLGVARDEVWTVAFAGVGALLCLRWSALEVIREQQERERLERKRAHALAAAYGEIGEALGGTLSHVRLVKPSNRCSINGLEISTPAWRLERAPVRPRE